MERNLAETSY